MLKVPGPVDFHQRTADRARAIGATYDRNRDVLWLLAQAQSGGGGRDGRRKDRGDGRHRRPRARRPLRPALEDRPRRRRQPHHRCRRPHCDADAGRSEGSGDAAERQQPHRRHRRRAQSMSAKDIDLTYGPDGRTLQHAEADGAERGASAGRGGAGAHHARSIDLTMAPDGTTVTQLNATESVVLELPAQGRCQPRPSSPRRWWRPAPADPGSRARRSKGRWTTASRGQPAATSAGRRSTGDGAAADRPDQARAGRSPAGRVPRQRQVLRRHSMSAGVAARRVPGRQGQAGPLPVARRPRSGADGVRRTDHGEARTIELTMEHAAR